MNFRDLRSFTVALADFYAPGLTADTYVDRAFALTSRLLRFSLNSHGVIERKTGVLTATFDTSPPGLADAFGAFSQHMAKYPAFRFDPTVAGGMPFSARDFYSRPAFHDLDIYQDVYRPMRYVDHAFMHVPSGPETTVFVGFLRDGRAFDAGEKALMSALQPHLANGRRLAVAVTAAQDTPRSPEMFAEAGFTPRECDVLHWLALGKSNEDIAEILHVRADSVSRHLQAIYTKLGVENRVSAAIRALDFARIRDAERLAHAGQGVLLRATPR